MSRAIVSGCLLALVAGGVARADDPPPPAAPAARAPDEDHAARGAALYSARRYREALAEYRHAYAARQDPALLYPMGKAHQMLGDAREALDCYRRYLAAADLDATTRADVEARIARLRPLAAPSSDENELAPGTQLVPVHYEMHRNNALMGAGIATLAVGYVPALVCGALFASLSGNDSQFRGASLALLVPVIGPLVSGLIFREPAWSLPWIFADGAAQVAGLIMTIAGARSTERVPVLGRLRILPYATAHGGGTVLVGQF